MAMAVAHLPNILPHTPVAILGDNLDVVQAVNRAISNSPPGTAFHLRTGHTGHCLHIPPYPLPHQIHVAWIKGHAHFMGNELADYFSKWAAQALTWRPSLLPPPPPPGGSHQRRLGHHFKNTEAPHPLSLLDPPAHSPTLQHRRKFLPAKQFFFSNRLPMGVRHVWMPAPPTPL